MFPIRVTPRQPGAQSTTQSSSGARPPGHHESGSASAAALGTSSAASHASHSGSVALGGDSALSGRVVLGIKRKAVEMSTASTDAGQVSQSSGVSSTAAPATSATAANTLDAFNSRPISQFKKIAQLGQGTYGTVFRYVMLVHLPRLRLTVL